MTAPSSNVCSTGEDKSKRIIVHRTLSQSCSVNEDKSKQSIVNKNLSPNYSADVGELCSKEAHTTDKLKSVFAPATRARGLKDNFGRIVSRYCIA